MQVWNVGLLRAARWKYKNAINRQKFVFLAPSHKLCRTVSSQLRHVSTIGKNLLNSNISSRPPRNIANFGPLTAEIALEFGAPQYKFKPVSHLGFITAATSLTGGEPNFVRSFAVSWAGALYIHFWGSCPLTEFCYVQNSLCVQVLRSRILTALLHGTTAVGLSKLCGVVQGMELRNFRRGRHLYLAGRSSRSHRPTF